MSGTRAQASRGLGWLLGRVWTQRVGFPWQALALVITGAILTHALRLPAALSTLVALLLGATMGVALIRGMTGTTEMEAPAHTQDKGCQHGDGNHAEPRTIAAQSGWHEAGTASRRWHKAGTAHRQGHAGRRTAGWHQDGRLYPVCAPTHEQAAAWGRGVRRPTGRRR